VRDGSKIREIPGGNGSVVPNQRFFLLLKLNTKEYIFTNINQSVFIFILFFFTFFSIMEVSQQSTVSQIAILFDVMFASGRRIFKSVCCSSAIRLTFPVKQTFRRCL